MLTALVLLALIPQSTSRDVSWSEIRAAVEDTICVAGGEPDAGRPGLAIGWRARCGLPEPATPAQVAVQEAIRRSGSLIVSLRLDELIPGSQVAPGQLTNMKRDIVMRVDLLRTLVPRIATVLREASLSCPDLPPFQPAPARAVDWQTFAPFLQAFVWVDPETPKLDGDGQPTGKWNHGLHTCLDINGLEELKQRNAALERAGFVIAMDSDVVWPRAKEHFGQLLKTPELQALQDGPARTAFLRTRLAEYLATDAEVRHAACQMLDEYRGDLGVIVNECSTDPGHTPAR